MVPLSPGLCRLIDAILVCLETRNTHKAPLHTVGRQGFQVAWFNIAVLGCCLYVVFVALSRSTSMSPAVRQFTVKNLFRKPLFWHSYDMTDPSELSLSKKALKGSLQCWSPSATILYPLSFSECACGTTVAASHAVYRAPTSCSRTAISRGVLLCRLSLWTVALDYCC